MAVDRLLKSIDDVRSQIEERRAALAACSFEDTQCYVELRELNRLLELRGLLEESLALLGQPVRSNAA